MSMEEIWVIGKEEWLGSTASSVRRGGWSLSALAMKGGKKGTWEVTLDRPKDGGLGFVSGGTVRRISSGEGWIDSEGWEFKGERERKRERERERAEVMFLNQIFFLVRTYCGAF